jgi:hypothetical protein
MRDLIQQYKIHFKEKKFVISVIVSIVFLLLSFVINFYAGTYATRNASNSVQDIVLSNIPVYNVDDIFVYGPLIMWAFVGVICLARPKIIPFLLKSIALFIFIRAIFITLTHIGPFPDQIALDAAPGSWITKFTFGGDLFFSAHTGLPFLMALTFHKNKFLFWIFNITAVFFGIIVLLGHLHYTIDVMSAFFITYTISQITKVFFKSDFEVFDDEKIELDKRV